MALIASLQSKYQNNMASTIQPLIFKYKEKVIQQENWGETSEVQRIKGLRLLKLADGLMSLIVMGLCSDQKIAKISDQSIKKYATNLLQEESKTRKVEVDMLKKVLGFFILEELGNHPILNGIKEEFELTFEEQEVEDEVEELNLTLTMQMDQSNLDELDFHNFISSLPSTTQSSKSRFEIGGREMKNISAVDNSFETWGNDTHSMKVLAYLKDISAPQTELSYLCQSMGWKLNFIDKISGQNRFQVVAEVDFEFKRVKKLLSQSYVAKNKKSGRMFASFKMLKKIYINFPEIWDMYDQKRNKKSLIIEKNSHPQFIPMDVLNEKVETISISKQKDEELSRQKEAYLKNINSFKSQLNLLVQNNSGVISYQIVEKMQVDGPGSKWKVKGELVVKYKGKQREKEAIQQNLSSKLAEQAVVKGLVTWLYETYPQILQIMMLIKNKKSIKT